MYAHVPVKRSFVAQILPANLACVRFLPSVRSLVSCHSSPSGEAFLAESAFVRSIVLVNLKMPFQIIEMFTAYRTEGLPFDFLACDSLSVNVFHVPLEVRGASVDLAANVALFRTFQFHWYSVIAKLMHRQPIVFGECFMADHAYEFAAIAQVNLFVFHQIDRVVKTFSAMFAGAFVTLEVRLDVGTDRF